MPEEDNAPTFEGINDRLKQIAENVKDDSLPLDDALDLFEEAVQLGLQASNMLEEGVSADMRAEDPAAAEPGGETSAGPAAAPGAVSAPSF